MEKLGYLAKYNFVNSIHDSVMFLPASNLVEECCYNIKQVLTSPCTRLLNPATASTNGLVVDVEISKGGNWKNYDPVTNPLGMQEIKLK